MSRDEMKEILGRIIEKLRKCTEEAPTPACIFEDNPCDQCDITTFYGVGEEN